jgi:hypothetical protein
MAKVYVFNFIFPSEEWVEELNSGKDENSEDAESVEREAKFLLYWMTTTLTSTSTTTSTSFSSTQTVFQLPCYQHVNYRFQNLSLKSLLNFIPRWLNRAILTSFLVQKFETPRQPLLGF